MPPPSASKRLTREKPELCSICLDASDDFCVLRRCKHHFCVACLKEWENVQRNNSTFWKVMAECPMCRCPFQYAIRVDAHGFAVSRPERVRDMEVPRPHEDDVQFVGIVHMRRKHRKHVREGIAYDGFIDLTN